jgi:membrane glycosyltransferase
MPTQDLQRKPVATQTQPHAMRLWRWAVFLPALLATGLMIRGVYFLLAQSGMSALEYLLLALIGLTFVWVTIAVSTAMIGLLHRRFALPTRGPDAPEGRMSVALLVPVYNEDPVEVFGNARAMLVDLGGRSLAHDFTLFVLSDTQDAAIAEQERLAFARLADDAPVQVPVYYRRRARNTDKKVGNLVDWITGWGGAYEAMIVLDADSLMAAQALDRLACEMAADSQAGLIQSFPQLLGGQTLFARLQQFSHTAYGWLLAEGLATWSQSEGNYWGHNAIIRTAAFASAAGLPYLNGRDLILSHDFVEASLLRRAGWRVRFMPRITGSFEAVPGTLIDYVLRDRRWCRGNLQHLRLLGTAGLHPVSRFHLFQGAAAYLVSPAWFVLLVFWTLLGRDKDTNVITYFSEANPLFPNWPPAMTHIDSAMFLLVMYAMLLAPKVAGASVIALNRKAARLYGGKTAFLTAFLIEVALSVAYAPILMIQQSKSVLRAVFTRAGGWSPQSRTGTRQPWRVLFGFHWLETLLGLLLTAGLLSGLVSLWLLPIVFSLLMAVPLSAASAWVLDARLPGGLRLESPQTLREPAIEAKARLARSQVAAELTAPGIAAE